MIAAIESLNGRKHLSGHYVAGEVLFLLSLLLASTVDIFFGKMMKMEVGVCISFF